MNGSSARIACRDGTEGGYLLAYLGCRFGQSSLLRLGVGSVQRHLNLEDLPVVEVSYPNVLARAYIGDKVRQAEHLRAWAKRTESLIADEFDSLVKDPLQAQRTWRASSSDLDPYRINPKHYDPVVLDLLRRAEKNGHRLQALGELFGPRQMSGGATPKGAQYFSEGVLFARVQNVKPLRLDLSDAAYIDKAADDELARSRCAVDDVILSITGYPGTAALVTEDDLPVNINQHSVRFDVKAGVLPGFVCAALNSKFVKYQVDRLAIGGTRDALDYPSVSRLLIPRFDVEVEIAIDESVRDFVAAVKLSQRLTTAAKLLVEALIEGRVTEADLIAAQQALSSGSDHLDRALLARLKTDGFDGSGDHLFSDLDQLYELLTQAEHDDNN